MSVVINSKLTLKTQGFTLIELVIVIIVLGILAATAGPKLIGKSSFEDYTVRDQLISRLRLVQLQGMNADPDADGTCYWLVVKNSCFYHEQNDRDSSGVCSAPISDYCNDDSFNQYNSVSFPSGMLEESNYRFDLQGKLLINETLISDAYNIDLVGDNDLAVEIETEGYIHAYTE